MQFFFLLMPIHPEQMAHLGVAGRDTVEKRLTQTMGQEFQKIIAEVSERERQL
jgi:hypothetical protein